MSRLPAERVATRSSPSATAEPVAWRAVRIAFELWAGSLWALLGWVTLTIFHFEPSRQVAGAIAGRLFEIQAYASVPVVAACAWQLRRRAMRSELNTRRALWPLYGASALLLFSEWCVRPLMYQAAASGASLGLSFGAWHGVSSLFFAVAALLALVFSWRGVLWGDALRERV